MRAFRHNRELITDAMMVEDLVAFSEEDLLDDHEHAAFSQLLEDEAGGL